MSICTLSIASIDAFSKVCSSFPRLDVTLRIDGHEIPMMYDTGAADTCMTMKTFEKYFLHAKRLHHKTNLVGAGNNDLKLCRIYTLPVTYKGRSANCTFMVCEHLEQYIQRIDLINDLDLSYDARSKQVFAISQVPDTLLASGETKIQPFTTAIIFAHFNGHLNPGATYVATIFSTPNRYILKSPEAANSSGVSTNAPLLKCRYPWMTRQCRNSSPNWEPKLRNLFANFKTPFPC